MATLTNALQNGVVVIHVTGDVGKGDVEQIENAITELLVIGAPFILVDLEKAGHVNQTLDVRLAVVNRQRVGADAADSPRIAIAGRKAKVDEHLRMTHLAEYIQVFATVAEGVTGIKQR